MAVCKFAPPFVASQSHLPHPKSATLQRHFSPVKELLSVNFSNQLSTPFLKPFLKPQQTKEKETLVEDSSNALSVAFPSLAYSNTLFFNAAYNCQVVVRDDEPEESLVGRFRREVFKARVIQDCRRRRFFETSQEKRKRKTREAARRNRKRVRWPSVQQKKVKVEEASKTKKKKKQEDNSDDDNWEFLDINLPYC